MCGSKRFQKVKNFADFSVINFCLRYFLFLISNLDLKTSFLHTAEELSHIRAIVRALQPTAEIIECDYADVDIARIINTGMFSFDDVATSAAWVQHIERDNHEIEEEEREHSHHHHNHHHHDHDEHGNHSRSEEHTSELQSPR